MIECDKRSKMRLLYESTEWHFLLIFSFFRPLVAVVLPERRADDVRTSEWSALRAPWRALKAVYHVMGCPVLLDGDIRGMRWLTARQVQLQWHLLGEVGAWLKTGSCAGALLHGHFTVVVKSLTSQLWWIANGHYWRRTPDSHAPWYPVLVDVWKGNYWTYF